MITILIKQSLLYPVSSKLVSLSYCMVHNMKGSNCMFLSLLKVWVVNRNTSMVAVDIYQLTSRKSILSFGKYLQNTLLIYITYN